MPKQKIHEKLNMQMLIHVKSHDGGKQHTVPTHTSWKHLTVRLPWWDGNQVNMWLSQFCHTYGGNTSFKLQPIYNLVMYELQTS